MQTKGPSTSLSRRTLIGGLGAGATAGLLGSRAGLAQPAIGKGSVLTISTWGGVTSDGIKNFLGAEFTKQTGATLAFDIGGQGARYNKLLAQKGNQTADVFFGTDEALVSGQRAGVLSTVRRKNIPNAADVHDWASTVKGGLTDETLPGVPYTLISYVLAYNPDVVKTAPTSWGDLWRPEFKGKLAFASPVHSAMPFFVIIAAELAGGSAKNPDAGFKKLAELKPNKLTVFWTDWAPQLKTGDTTAATEFDYYLDTMKRDGYPIAYVLPDEGAIAAAEYAAPVTGSKNPELIEAFLNLMLDPKVQESFAVQTFQGPTNKKVVLSAEAASKAAYGDKLKKIRFFDPVFAADMRPAWTERMNTEVVPAWQSR